MRTGALGLAALATASVAAGTVIAAGLGVSTKAAAEAARAQELLRNAIRATGAAIDAEALFRQATALQTITGFSDETIVSIQRLLIQFGATQEQVEALTPRILDFAVATGRDAADAALTFGRALTGQDQALRRVLGKMGEGINFTENFAGTIALLDKRFGGTAVTAGRDLFGAFARLRTAANDLQEALGDPILGPLSNIVSRAADATAALVQFAKEHPEVAQAVTTLAGVMSIAMVGAGGWIALTLVLPKVVSLLAAYATAQAAAAGVTVTATSALLAQTAAWSLLGKVASATLVGAILTGVLLVFQNINNLVANTASMVTFITSFFQNLGQGVDRAFKKASIDSANRYYDVLRSLGERALPAAATAQERAAKTAEELAKGYERAAAAVRLLGTQSELAASRAARAKLEQAGLSVEDVERIEADRVRAVQRGQERELKVLVTAKKVELEALRANVDASQETRSKAEQQYLDLVLKLDGVRLQSAQEVARRTAEAVREGVEQRIEHEKQARERELEVLRQRVDDTRSVEAERAAAEESGRQGRLRLMQVEEGVRVEMLRRVGELEVRAAGDVLSARESLLRAQEARSEASAVRAAQRRADLVRQGLLTEEDARKQVEAEALRRLEERVRAESDLQDQRVRNAERAVSVERSLAQSESESKLRLLEAETEARRVQVVTNERLRESELRLALAVAQAETRAKVAELQAQLGARIRVAQAELAASRSPEERRERAEGLDALVAGQREAAAAFQQALAERTQATATQLTVIQGQALAELSFIDQELAAKRKQTAEQLAGTLVQLESRSASERAAAVQRLAELQKSTAEDVAEVQEDLRKKVEGGEITQAEADRRLAPFRRLGDQIASTLAQRASDAERVLGPLEQWVEAVRRRVDALRPLADAVRNIAGGGVVPPAGAPTGVPVMAAAAVGVGAVTNLFTFQGTTFNLTPDEVGLLSRIIRAIMGPEFNAAVADYLKAQPGPRR